MSRGSHLVFNGLPAHFETRKQVLSSTTPKKLLWTPRIFLMTDYIYFFKITKKGLMNLLIRFSISLHTQAWDGVASHKAPPWFRNTITKPRHSTSSTQKPQNHHIQYYLNKHKYNIMGILWIIVILEGNLNYWVVAIKLQKSYCFSLIIATEKVVTFAGTKSLLWGNTSRVVI